MAQERINRQGQRYIAGLARTVYQLWGLMCAEAGIPSDSTFVDLSVFEGSKYLTFYHNALSRLWEAEAQYRAGGYVGLTVEGR